MSEVSEHTLIIIERAIVGDEKAFEELIGLYANTIAFHARKLVYDKNSAEDAAQEIVFQIYRSIGKLKKPKTFHAWMHRLIRHTCANFNRKSMSGVRKLESAYGEVDDVSNIFDSDREYDPVLCVEKDATSELLYNMIMELPQAYRETIILRYYDDLSYKEIAYAMGITVKTVSTNLIRARNKLKAMMDKKNLRFQEDFSKEEVFCGIAPLGTAISTGATESSSALASNITQNLSQNIAAWNSNISVSSGFSIKAVITGAMAVVVVVSGVIFIDSRSHVSEEAQAPQEAVQVFAAEKRIAPWSGTAKVVFADSNGADNSYNVAEVAIQTEGEDPKVITWEIWDESGLTIQQGSGNPIGEQVLSTLPDGEYSAVFNLSNGDSAITGIIREFVVNS